MVSTRFQNTVLAGTVALAAVAGTLVMPRLANNPTLLYVAGQVQIATGHTSDGLSLISRAALASPENKTPAAKPSPAKSAAEMCPMSQNRAAVKMPVTLVRAHKVEIAMAKVKGSELQSELAQPSIAPTMVRFDMPPADALRKMDSKEMNIRIQGLQERINRQVQKALAASGAPVA